MTRRVLFVLMCGVALLAPAASALAQEATTPPPGDDASEQASEGATEQASESASEPASEEATEDGAGTDAEEGETRETPSPEPSGAENPTAEPGAEACPPEDAPEESTAVEATPAAAEEGDPAQQAEDCPDDSDEPGFVIGPQNAPEEPRVTAVGSDASLGADTGEVAALDAAGPVPSRVDAGGGYLAGARDDRPGAAWLGVVAAAALLSIPRVRRVLHLAR